MYDFYVSLQVYPDPRQVRSENVRRLQPNHKLNQKPIFEKIWKHHNSRPLALQPRRLGQPLLKQTKKTLKNPRRMPPNAKNRLPKIG